MTVIQFGKDFFHNRFPEEDRLRGHMEFLTVKRNGSHFAFIEIYDLPVLSQESLLLLSQVFRVYSVHMFLFNHL